MIRRIVLLLALAAIGWYAVTRLLRPQEVSFDDDDLLWPDDQEKGGGFTDRVGETASGAVARTRRAAEAPIDRIRSIVGGHSEEPQTAVATSDTTAASAAARSSQESDLKPDHDQSDNAADAVTTASGAVKGNINRDGEKIYHLPGDPAYERTHAEMMFASAAEAEAAGYRRAGQRHNR